VLCLSIIFFYFFFFFTEAIASVLGYLNGCYTFELKYCWKWR